MHAHGRPCRSASLALCAALLSGCVTPSREDPWNTVAYQHYVNSPDFPDPGPTCDQIWLAYAIAQLGNSALGAGPVRSPYTAWPRAGSRGFCSGSPAEW